MDLLVLQLIKGSNRCSFFFTAYRCSDSSASRGLHRQRERDDGAIILDSKLSPGYIFYPPPGIDHSFVYDFFVSAGIAW